MSLSNGARLAISGLLVAAALLALPSCSIRRLAVNRLGDALAAGGSTYASDDDPEFVRDAVPFGLKTIEGLLAESPNHKGLLLAATSGFTQYAYAYLDSEADFVEDADLARATALRQRAVRMYKRAIRYGLRGLEAAHAGAAARLVNDPQGELAAFGKADVPQMYWTAAAWGAAIGAAKHESELSADLPVVEALLRRCLALDDAWNDGAVYDTLIALDGGRPASAGGSLERAKHAFERAVAISKGRRAAPFVSWAETVDVGAQNRAEFEQMLARALAVDPDAVPGQRLANLIAQKRARWLLARKDNLFVE